MAFLSVVWLLFQCQLHTVSSLVSNCLFQSASPFTPSSAPSLKQLSLSSSLRTSSIHVTSAPHLCDISSLQLVIYRHRSGLHGQWLATIQCCTPSHHLRLQHISARASRNFFFAVLALYSPSWSIDPSTGSNSYLLSTLAVWCCQALQFVAGGSLVCPPLFSPLYIGDDTQQHLKNITLKRVTLDVVCDVVVNFEHMKEIQCMSISDPQEVWLLYACVCIISVSCVLKTP